MKYPPTYYAEYLNLDKILTAQSLKSLEFGQKEAHDETLFIIIHQTYELWFKQILHELKAAITLFSQEVMRPKDLSKIIHLFERVTEIQRVLIDQLKIMETMAPLDFMEFRDFLVPASGFQSVQFRSVETLMGLKPRYRLKADLEFFNIRLNQRDQEYLKKLEQENDLLSLVNSWLERMPFMQDESFDFWKQYQGTVNDMLEIEAKIIDSASAGNQQSLFYEKQNLLATRANFEALFDENKYQNFMSAGKFRFSRKAKLASIFIKLYHEEPILHAPARLLDLITDIDENFTLWRYKHSLMAHRLLGAKVGTGGSSGHEYLKNAADNNKIFIDLFDLATYLLPRNKRPLLPHALKRKLGLNFEEND